MSYYTASGSLRWPEPGPSDVPSYQLSAIPWMTSSTAPNGSSMEISFPNTTRWVELMNTSNAAIRVGFSENGVNANPASNAHYFTVPGTAGTQTTRWELRCSKLYLRGEGASATFSLAAGLSAVPSRYFDAISVSQSRSYRQQIQVFFWINKTNIRQA